MGRSHSHNVKPGNGQRRASTTRTRSRRKLRSDIARGAALASDAPQVHPCQNQETNQCCKPA
jgi:hypothetical protein